jgi:hypothetical protein
LEGILLYAPHLGHFLFLHKLSNMVEHLAQLVACMGINLSFGYNGIYHLS